MGYILMFEKIYITEVIQWKYIKIFLVQTKCINVTKKTTGNIGYILTV